VSASGQTVVIRPRSGWVPVDFREVWHHRELALMLAWREILIRYKQSLIGAAWAIVQPLATMLVFTVLFGLLLGRGHLPTDHGVPYAVSTYCALLPWQLFAQSVARASVSITTNQSLISKVYFPRLIIPLAPVLAALADFGIAFLLLIGMMLWYKILPGTAIFFLPVFILMALATALGSSLLLAAANTVYRDIQQAVPFLIQILMYVSPVLYSAQSILHNQPQWVQVLYFLNPMTGVVEGFRWALLGAAPPQPLILSASILAVSLLLLGSAYYFKRIERQFADIV
jgi:lipopolysaccharide transport system permease protein